MEKLTKTEQEPTPAQRFGTLIHTLVLEPETFEGKYVVPSKYIDLYWSNKGQRDCNERRLAIRFRIDPSLSEVNGYRYVDSNTLVPYTIPNRSKSEKVCQ